MGMAHVRIIINVITITTMIFNSTKYFNYCLLKLSYIISYATASSNNNNNNNSLTVIQMTGAI